MKPDDWTRRTRVEEPRVTIKAESGDNNGGNQNTPARQLSVARAAKLRPNLSSALPIITRTYLVVFILLQPFIRPGLRPRLRGFEFGAGLSSVPILLLHLPLS
jgi:hypothetical protein